ncbi:MAG: deoxyribonuclease IV [Thermodesulfobacteriota bacterium]
MTAQERHFGAHESVAGGLAEAFGRIKSVGGTALQVFTRNQRQWEAAPVSPDEAEAFANAWREWGPYPVASHASYLLNPASPDEALRKRGVASLAAELERCRALGVPWVVLHPGAAMGAGREEALGRAARSLDEAFEASGGDGPLILLENTAGQGTGIGSDFRDLAAIIAASRHPGRLGICLDTCHAYAAGYDVATRRGLDEALAMLDKDRLKLVHVNDAKAGLGSRLDRHEHIGKGAIGLEGFRAIVNHPVLARLPMILETHKEKDLKEDVENLRVLRSLVKG